MPYKIKVINPKSDKRWDEFVLKHPMGSIYHHSSWGNVLKSTFGHIPFYIALENSKTGKFEGILPFMLIDSMITGKRLVSLPFTSYCCQLVPESELENAIRFALKNHSDIDYLELKLIKDVEDVSEKYEKQSSYVTHILDLDVSQEQLFKSFHNTSIRHRIKRAEKNNLRLKISEKEEGLKKFYKLYTVVRKKHGLPPQPYTFFLNMWRNLKPKNFLFVPTIENQEKTIAAAIVLKFNNTFHLEYSASDQRFLKLSPNQILIWELIKIAHEGGARYFDFGRSSLLNKPLIEFKERWRAKRYNLFYYYFPSAKTISEKDGIKRKFLGLINRHLPLPVLRLEGKFLYPHLG